MSDEELMLRVKRHNDGGAYEELYSRHSGRSRIICHKSYPAEADDLNQEVWAKIWKDRSKFWDNGAFIAWLIWITANTCKDAHKKRTRRKEVQMPSTENQADQTLEQWLERLAYQAEQIYRDWERAEKIRRMLNRLPEQERELLKQEYLDERSIKDMAKERGHF